MISICTYNEVGISVKEGRKVYLKRGKKKKEGERKIKHKIRRERQTAKGGRENTVQKGSRSIYVAREKERGGSMLRRWRKREKLAHGFGGLPNIDPRRELKLDFKFCKRTMFDVLYRIITYRFVFFFLYLLSFFLALIGNLCFWLLLLTKKLAV